jgi:hypothetical protein
LIDYYKDMEKRPNGRPAAPTGLRRPQFNSITIAQRRNGAQITPAPPPAPQYILKRQAKSKRDPFVAAASYIKSLSRGKRVLATVIMLAVLAGLIGVLVPHNRVPSVPKAIRNRAEFGIFIPKTTANGAIKAHSFTYDQDTKVVKYVLKAQGGGSITFTQQAAPSGFQADPNAFSDLVASMQPFSTFESASGDVALTRPAQLQGQESAVMNSHGTLLFAKPSKDFPVRYWQQLFDDMHQFAQD